jgi:DNA-binding GntR family transcriptional regulator
MAKRIGPLKRDGSLPGPTVVSLDAAHLLRAADGRGTARPSRTAQVHEALRQAIIEQQLKAGTRLPEDAIGEVFGTSRTIAREAFGRLAVEGLVDLLPNRGAYVANPSLDEGRDVFVVRRGLERMVVESLAGMLRPQDVAHLRAFSAREKAVSATGSVEAIRLAGEFHLALARMTGNQLLVRYVTEIVSRCSLILAMYGRPHSAECGVRKHAKIIDALAAGDREAALRLMDHHLEHVASRALLEPRTERDIRDVLAPYAQRQAQP